jgi:hypothetical protein
MDNTNKEDGDQNGNDKLGKISCRRKEKHGRKQIKKSCEQIQIGTP